MINLETFKLDSGNHETREEGMCAMEMVAYLAGEPHSDHPKCACPALTNYVMRLNDKFTDSERQLLKPYLPRLLNTRDGNILQRAKILAHGALTVFAPLALDAAQLPEWAEKMRALPFGEWEANKKVAWEARDAAYAARAAQDAYAAANAAAAAHYADAQDAAYAARAAAAAHYADAQDAAYAARAAASAAAAAYAAYAASAASAANRKPVVEAALKLLDDALNANNK